MSVVVDVIMDTVCPWCYIGKRRLERALALRPGIDVAVRWRPFLLNPEIPADGIDRTAYLLKKFGSETRIQRIYGAIADAGLTVKIPFDFDRIDRTPNTVNTHRFIAYAAGFGDIGALVESLFQSYFIDGLDTGNIDVLADIGASHGLDAGAVGAFLSGPDGIDDVYEGNARAHRLGINGVPAFVFNDQFVLSGAQDPETLARVLDVALTAGMARHEIKGRKI